jgi:hypothetical protein
MLRRLFPQASIIVPVRQPLQHVASLMRQHRNFLKLHSEDAFGRRYMESIGHFEFGAALKPIDIGGWMSDVGDLSPLTADYWLTYWAGAFETLAGQRDSRLAFISYERLCAEAPDTLRTLAAFLGLEDPAPVLVQAGKFHPPAQYPPDDLTYDRGRLERAMAAYDRVLAAALV